MGVTGRTIAVVTLLAAFATGAILHTNNVPQIPRIACDLAIGCAFQLDGKTIRVQAYAPITPSRPFELRVSAPHAIVVKGRFDMAGMTMPTPVYILQRQGTNWQTNVTLPYCVSGRSDWVLSLSVDHATIELKFGIPPSA